MVYSNNNSVVGRNSLYPSIASLREKNSAEWMTRASGFYSTLSIVDIIEIHGLSGGIGMGCGCVTLDRSVPRRVFWYAHIAL